MNSLIQLVTPREVSKAKKSRRQSSKEQRLIKEPQRVDPLEDPSSRPLEAGTRELLAMAGLYRICSIRSTDARHQEPAKSSFTCLFVSITSLSIISPQACASSVCYCPAGATRSQKGPSPGALGTGALTTEALTTETPITRAPAIGALVTSAPITKAPTTRAPAIGAASASSSSSGSGSAQKHLGRKRRICGGTCQCGPRTPSRGYACRSSGAFSRSSGHGENKSDSTENKSGSTERREAAWDSSENRPKKHRRTVCETRTGGASQRPNHSPGRALWPTTVRNAATATTGTRPARPLAVAPASVLAAAPPA